MRKQRNPFVLFLALFIFSCSMPLATVAVADMTKTVATQSAMVNINTASAEELSQKLKGIGMNKAKAIVEYRQTVGKFISVEQLAEVKGIGSSTLEKNRSSITLK